MVITTILVGLMLWNGTLTQTWRPFPTTMPASAASAPAWSYNPTVTERTIPEVWSQWHDDALFGWIGPAELTLILTFILAQVEQL